MSWQFSDRLARAITATPRLARVFQLALLCLATSLLVQAAQAQSNVSARVEWYGTYTPSDVKIVDDPRSPTGHASIQTPIPPKSNTDRIPGQEGIRFGFSYVLSGDNGRDVTVRRVFRFPGSGMTNVATGAKTKSYEDEGTYAIGQSILMAWSFKDARPEQIVFGDWVFEVWVGGRKIIEREFAVYPP